MGETCMQLLMVAYQARARMEVHVPTSVEISFVSAHLDSLAHDVNQPLVSRHACVQ